ncbi:MAG: type II toxin-antitoxin system HicB family antitoxin [Oscillospiraceae bacterium]|nr:type II toxin-antitoxin system HicB family antitoxin [Oscillospiraceae bacterium]
MRYVYPAIFYPEENSTYSVIFPDLNDLATQGSTLADAVYMAEDACSLYLFNSLKDGEKLPEPSKLDDIIKDDDSAFINMILVDIAEFTKKHGDQAVKKTLSIPAWLNTACEERCINFSKVLQEALVNIIQN